MKNNWKEKLWERYSSGEFSETVHQGNRDMLKKVYGFSIAFGAISLTVISLITHFSLDPVRIAYYSFYILVGLIGLLLCYTKSGKFTPTIFAFFVSLVVFIIFSRSKPITESILIFLGFVISYEMLLDLNPLIYTPCLLLAEGSVFTLFALKIIPTREVISLSTFINFLIVNAIAIYISFWKRRVLLKRYRTEKKIKAEREKSEELLLNVLPRNIMEELRENGKAEPVSYDSVSVFFCEVMNFQKLASTTDASLLVSDLNDIYEFFDALVEKNFCVRIKTFGDVYMAVAGLPLPNPNHAECAVNCAKDFISVIKYRNENSTVPVKVRIGISSGNAIAGIVGIKKYIYDVFGDTVNTASRMKNLSGEMEITVSESTYKLVKANFDFCKQEAVEVKGKGLMETYVLK